MKDNVKNLLYCIDSRYEIIYKEIYSGSHQCSVEINTNNFSFILFVSDDVKKSKNLFSLIKDLYRDLTDDEKDILIDEIFQKIKEIQTNRLKEDVKVYLIANMPHNDIYNADFVSPDSCLEDYEIFSIITEVISNDNNKHKN